MPTPKNKTIARLSDWAADPVRMARFDALAQLSQRTAFVKSLLCLRDSDDVIRMQIHAVCEHHGLECRPPRGTGFDGVHIRSMTTLQRYVGSFLMNTLLGSSHGGIEESEDGLDPDNLLDRMIYSYRRYLAVAAIAVTRADVSFEMFFVLYKAYSLGEVDLQACDNCGARFVHLRLSHTPHCPLCTLHRHAEVPKTYQAGRVPGGSGGRRADRPVAAHPAR